MTRPRPTRRAFTAGATAGLLAPLAGARRRFQADVDALAAQDPEARPLAEEYGLEVQYLNHASVGTVPRAVRDAHVRYLQLCEMDPSGFIWGGRDVEVDAVHAKAARFVGCGPEEIAVTRSTTEAFSLLAQGLSLGEGDEVLFGSLNHVGASRSFEVRSERDGYTVRRFEFPVPDAAGLTAENVVEIYAREISERTRLLVLPHIDNVVGLRHPVREIAAAARERGVRWVAVDGAQAVGMIPVDVTSLGVDLYATSAHKWLQAPKGTGLLYVNEDLRNVLRPLVVTWGHDRWKGTARVYSDYGTRDLPKLLTLGDAIDFQRRVAGKDREVHDRALRELACRRTEAHPRLVWRSPSDYELGGAIYAIEVEGVSADDVFQALSSVAGFIFRPFSRPLNVLRISPNTLNTVEELDSFFDYLEAYLR